MKLKRFLWSTSLLLLILALTGCMDIVNRTFNLKYHVTGVVQTLNGEYLGEVILKCSGGSTVMTASEFTIDEDGQNWRFDDLSGKVTITPTKMGWAFIPESVEVEANTKNIKFTALPEGPGQLLNKFIKVYEEKDMKRLVEIMYNMSDADLSFYQNKFDSMQEVKIDLLSVDSFTSNSRMGSATVNLKFDIVYTDGQRDHLSSMYSFEFVKYGGSWYIDKFDEGIWIHTDAMNIQLNENANREWISFYVTVPDRFIIETSYLNQNNDTVITLYDSNLSQIGKNDDSDGDYYSKIETPLSQGRYSILVEEITKKNLNCNLKINRVEE